VLSLPEFTGSFAIITHILGFRVGIWGTSHAVANAALGFFGRPDHVVQEKHLLQYPVDGMPLHSSFGLCHYGSHIGFWGLVMVCS